jgi:hypothetical protein
MARRESGRLTSISFLTQGLAALALLLAGVSLAPAAGATKLSQVRVGTHGDTTRIVLELDGPAPYRLMPSTNGGPLRIALDADSTARNVHSKSPLVRSVRVEPGQHGSTISVDLVKPDVSVEEMILAHPARIVLDLKRSGAPDAATARALATAAAMAEKPAPAEAPVAAATPPPAAAPPAPAATSSSPTLADPVPSDIAQARPAGSSPSPAPAAPEEAAPAVPAPAPSPAEATAASAPAASEAAAASAPAAPVASEPSEPTAPKPADVVVRKPARPPVQDEARDEGSLIGTLLSPTGFAVLAAVLVGLIVIGAMRRRREREDDDPLYSVMSADDAGSGAAAHEDVAPRWADDSPDEAETPHASLAETEPRGFQLGDEEPDAADAAPQLSLRARPPAEPEGDSIFGGATEPAHEPVHAAAPAPRTNGTELPGVASELAGRVSDLERRLEQLTEARERLERQVAAQTEELRVQRAAIARTQRVVRSMNKGEDLATEPVPRVPNA